MPVVAAQHAGAVLFFAVLIAFELARRSRLLALLRHPLYAYVARGLLVAAYFDIARLDPVVWLETNADIGVPLGVALAVAVAILRRADLSSVGSGPPGMLAQTALLAAVVASVEELIFRGAFVLAAAVTPTGAVLGSLGSSAAYVVWRAFAWRERTPRAMGTLFLGSLAVAAPTAFTRSLWPALIAHAAFALLYGPSRGRR